MCVVVPVLKLTTVVQLQEKIGGGRWLAVVS